MRSSIALVVSLAATACAHTPRSANDDDDRYIMAGSLLDCPPSQVRMSTTRREPHKLRGEGCGQVVTFAQMCRNPGPYETAYVQSVPPPQSVVELEHSYTRSRVFGGTGDQALAAWFMQSGRSREIKYGQGLAEARMRDIERPHQPEYIPAGSVVMMPVFWMAGNCRVFTYPTVFGKVPGSLPAWPAQPANAAMPYDEAAPDAAPTLDAGAPRE
jgi:hypothetical protein